MEFTWDPVKASSNRTKHKVTFEDAIPALLDPWRVEESDERFLDIEERLRVIGQGPAGVLVVVCVERAVSTRIISARPANAHEQETYRSPRR